MTQINSSSLLAALGENGSAVLGENGSAGLSTEQESGSLTSSP